MKKFGIVKSMNPRNSLKLSNSKTLQVSDRLKAELDDVLALSRKSSLASSVNNAKNTLEEEIDHVYFRDFTKAKGPSRIIENGEKTEVENSLDFQMSQLKEKIKSATKNSANKEAIASLEGVLMEDLPISRKIDFNQRQIFDSQILKLKHEHTEENNEETEHVRKKITLLDKNMIQKSFSP